MLAIKEINAAGGLLGRPVELVLYDGKTDAATISNAATKLTESDHWVSRSEFARTDNAYSDRTRGPVAEPGGQVARPCSTT